ncbi:hypothetical protein D3C72_1617730 [compost metagenome]
MILALEDLPEPCIAAGRHGNIRIAQLPYAHARPTRHLRARGQRRAQGNHQIQAQRLHLALLLRIASARRQRHHRCPVGRQALAHVAACQHDALFLRQQPGFQARQRAEQGLNTQPGRFVHPFPAHHQQSGELEILAMDEPLNHLMHPAGLLIPVNQQSHSVGLHFSCSCIRAIGLPRRDGERLRQAHMRGNALMSSR